MQGREAGMLEIGQDSWAFGVLTVVLVQAAICDVRTGKIYNSITYPAILMGFLCHFLMGGWVGEPWPGTMGLVFSIAGFLAGFLPLLLAWLVGGIGGGDAKIMGAVGALAGWKFALTSMFYGFAVAIVLSFIIMIRRRIALETLGRIWRFLWLTMLRAAPGGPDGKNSAKLPFGLALCIGTVIAMIMMEILGPNDSLFLLGF